MTLIQYIKWKINEIFKLIFYNFFHVSFALSYAKCSFIKLEKKFFQCDLLLYLTNFRFVACFVDTEWFMEIVSTAFYLDDCFVLCGLLSEDVHPQKKRIVTRKEWVDFLVDGILRLVFIFFDCLSDFYTTES